MKTMTAIVTLLLLCVPMVYAQQTPQMYMPYVGPPQPSYQPMAATPPRQIEVQTSPGPVSMYDQSYSGPMNIYGQPVFSAGPPRRSDQGQGQVAHDGFIPRIGWGIQGFGNYLWSYMPAPVRGETSSYDMAPGTGHVTIQNVPGNR